MISLLMVNISLINIMGILLKFNCDVINFFIRKDLNYNMSELLLVKVDGSSEVMFFNSRDKVGNVVIICIYE